ncbi:MAG: hypothetical protein QM346_07075 [Chloroflexota bacterium]|nr:hypothetical protein [Chloroflexota bacterium]
MRTVLSESPEPTSPQASPPSARSLFSLVLGLIAAYQAVRIFYVQPWLHVSSALDRWLAQYDCIIRPLCRQRQFSIDHAGVLLTLFALAAFTLALAGRNIFAPVVHAPRLPAWTSRPRLTRIACLLFALTGLEAVVYQTLRMAFAGAAPQPSVWLAGIGAMLLAAAVWDSEDAAVWTQTAAGLTVAGGAAQFLLGAAGLYAGNLLTAAAGLLGLALLWLGLRWSERAGAALHRLDLALALGIRPSLPGARHKPRRLLADRLRRRRVDLLRAGQAPHGAGRSRLHPLRHPRHGRLSHGAGLGAASLDDAGHPL